MQLSAGTFITTVATFTLLTGSCISQATETHPPLNSSHGGLFRSLAGSPENLPFFYRTERYHTTGLDICERISPSLSLSLSYCHNLDQWKQLSWSLAGIKGWGTANRMFFVGTQSFWNWFLFPDPEELKFYGLHSMLHSSYFSRVHENGGELQMWLVSGGRALFQLSNWLVCIWLRKEGYCSLVTMINFYICIWICVRFSGI